MTAASDSRKEELKGLRQEWGITFDDRQHQAEKIAKTFFPHLGDDLSLSAAEVKAFHSLSVQLHGKGAEFKDQHSNDGSDMMAPAEAQEKIDEIRGNKEHPYFNHLAPGHKAAKDKMRKLYRIKNSLDPDSD